MNISIGNSELTLLLTSRQRTGSLSMNLTTFIANSLSYLFSIRYLRSIRAYTNLRADPSLPVLTLIKPIVQKLRAFVKDSTDVINKISELSNLPDKIILGTSREPLH
ncbi:unnamed protein product [Coregonus sp. 'balchen']|nr:unnamed protein product [Coregonus sp. 'balchen']